MKGLLVSLLALALYVVSAVIAAHLLHPKRPLYLFALVAAGWGVGYSILYALTPQDFWFLPRAWMCSSTPLDFFYGLIVLALNCHTLIDCLSASCGGFSVSLLVVMFRAGEKPVTTDALVAKFKLGDQADTIYGWRLPHLERRGYLHRDATTGHYSLTSKGRVTAVIAHCLKRMMNLGKGG